MLPLISLQGVNVHLAGRHILKNVTWSLGAGEHWAFVGPNGSGKSTLLRVIAGTQWIDYDGASRTYSPDGVRLDSVTRAATWIRHVSAEQHERYVRLDLPLAGRAVIESGFDDLVYIARTLDVRQTERVDALIGHFELGDFASRPLRELSSGQVRRLLIARALVREPRVLILDEFTNGLDREARRDVLAFLDRIVGSVALIVASHRLSDFPTAITHSATLRDGTVAAAPGRPADRRLARASGQVATDSLTDAPVLVRIRHADVYRGRTLVLRRVDWQLRRGEHTAIRGANGAGKTTFAGLIAGTIAPATGADVVRFGLREPFDIWTLKERVAHVSDDLQIAYDRGETVEAVIASGFPSSIGLFGEPTAAQRAAVEELIGRIGLASLRGRTFTQLSFGERRKVLIARSLVRRPDIFILDEIWNGLDTVFRGALRALLGDMANAGTTLVAIAHDEDDDIVALTPRICTIENGTIREERRPRPA
ncbi:MAG: ATP-binding cassette domain-containing protein [Candidatus Velthaea sp.]